MKTKISETFPGQSFFSCDAERMYIMDYTNQTKNKKGIEWSDTEPVDIYPFNVENYSKLNITFCPFKENTIKLKGDSKEQKHCEGVLFPMKNPDNTWRVFLELKYPQKKENLGKLLNEARKQLISTIDLFRKCGVIEEKRLVYLIFSAPKYSKFTPFESWLNLEISELKAIRRKKFAIMRGVNKMDVISDTKIVV